MAVPYDDLDPGIRAVVRWLNDNGFTTTDSGDGKTKYANGEECAMECAMPFPNVAIRVDAPELVPECRRLVGLLAGRGITPVPMGPDIEEGVVNIQGHFDPTLDTDTGQAFILVTGLDDALLGAA